MHFVIHFPIVDLRPMISDTGKLTSPVWPMPDVYKSFLRNFGCVKDRLNGGNEYWTGEDKFCDAGGIIKFQNMRKPANPPMPYQIAPIYKRFYSDGYYLNKFEIGLSSNADELGDPFSDTRFYLEDIVSQIAALPVTIKNNDRKKSAETVQKTTVALQQAGTKLSHAYAASSTAFNKINPDIYKWVIAGEPLIVVIYKKDESVVLPGNARSTFKEFEILSKFGKVDLHNARIRFKGYTGKVWFIGIPWVARNDEAILFHETVRNLRMNLSRIHVEKEMIRIILNAIKTRKLDIAYNSEEALALEAYLKTQSEKIFKKVRFDLPQKDILDFALLNDNEINIGSYTNLEEETALFKSKFLKQNIQKIIAYRETVTPEIFFSYAWGPEREEVIDELYKSLEADKKYILVRDKVDLGYKGLISEFMQRIGQGNFVIVAISDKYLKSEFCMFELYELYRNSKLETKELLKVIYPIRIEDINLAKPKVISEYIQYWTSQEKEWEDLVTVNAARISPEQQVKYNRVKKIAGELGSLLDLLADINSLTTEMLSKDNFAEIKKAFEKRLAEMAGQTLEKSA